jgi:hypothetical protein
MQGKADISVCDFALIISTNVLCKEIVLKSKCGQNYEIVFFLRITVRKKNKKKALENIL